MAGDLLTAANAKSFRSQIRHIVGNLHVGVSLADIDAEMSRRVAKMRRQGADVTAAFTRAIKRIARAEHKKNQQLYHGVMSGSFKYPKRNPKRDFNLYATGKKTLAYYMILEGWWKGKTPETVDFAQIDKDFGLRAAANGVREAMNAGEKVPDWAYQWSFDFYKKNGH